MKKKISQSLAAKKSCWEMTKDIKFGYMDPALLPTEHCTVGGKTICPLHVWACFTSALSCGPNSEGQMEVDRAWDSCKAHRYVVNVCWNSQINGRGSSPNQGSIPGYILVLWAVIQLGRQTSIFTAAMAQRQAKKKGGGGNHLGTSHFQGLL